MSYLKLVNHPVRGLFPEKAKRAIDWNKAGFDPTAISRDQMNGFDTEAKDNHVTLYPIVDEAKLLTCKAFGSDKTIIDEVNSNANINDTAEIITDAAAALIKVAIKAVRDAQTPPN